MSTEPRGLRGYATDQDLARFFGVSTGTIAAWCYDGLPSLTLSRNTQRYSLDDARDWWLDSAAGTDQLDEFPPAQANAVRAAVRDGATPADAIAAGRNGELEYDAHPAADASEPDHDEGDAEAEPHRTPTEGPIERELRAMLFGPAGDRQGNAVPEAILALARHLDSAGDATGQSRSEPLLTQALIARALGVKACSVHRWRHDCGLPVVRLRDGRIRFRVSEVRDWHEQWVAAHQPPMGAGEAA